MKPAICIKCNREMNCERNDVLVFHKMEIVNYTDDIDCVALGDKFKCPVCGVEIVIGIGKPITAEEKTQQQLMSMIALREETVEITRLPLEGSNEHGSRKTHND